MIVIRFRLPVAVILFTALFSLSYSQNYNYAEVLQKSMWFYEAQRSGALPENNRVEWRGSSAIKDGSDVGHDLSGGWYDAGDNMKFNFPMASSITLLAWGALEYPQGYAKTGQWGFLLRNIKWVTDYFMKCHTAPNEFYGQIGEGMTDHKWWGAPEVFPNPRPAFKIDAQHPGSELAAEAAAALAASSILFKNHDPAYAQKLRDHAVQLYAFADTYRGLYHEAITDVVDFYKSWSGYTDELVWGALWLYMATADQKYLAKAESMYASLAKEPQSTTPKYKEALSWDDKTYGCYVLLAKLTDKQQYHTDTQRWLDWWSYGHSVRSSGGKTWNGESGIAYTPGGLAWVRQWGPLRYAANTAFAAFVYSDCTTLSSSKKSLYYNWAKSQIDYALGSNEEKRSFVCGFGVNPPTKPHHRSMHGPWLDDNGRTPVESRHVLYGALVGGPGLDGSFADERLDAVKNEVATDYNAGFSSALARLCKDNNVTPLANFPAPAKRDTEYVVDAKINTAGKRFTEISATIRNRTTWPARYGNKLTIKYFVNLSEVFAAGYTVSDVTVEYRNCTLCHDSLAVSALQPYGDDPNLFFTEISFATEAIFPGGQSAHRREVQFRVGLPERAPEDIWDPTNDHSFEGLTSMADTQGTPKIPAYEDGLLVWGVEPNGTAFVLSSWKVPDLSEPRFEYSSWEPSLFKDVGITVPFQPYRTGKQLVVVTTKNTLHITARNACVITLYSLSGQMIYKTDLAKEQSVQIPLTRIGRETVVLQATADNWEHRTRFVAGF